MAIRRIVTEGNDILLKKSKPVTAFDDRLGELIDDMIETMQEANGVGIAAVQVGVLRRVVIVAPDPEGEAPMALVNPEIIEREGACDGTEGCLSVPGRYGLVSRPQRVVVRAQDRNGRAFELRAEDYAARVVCHELDHLDGILYTTRAKEMYSQEDED